jgi:PKD repeat protein
MKPKYWAVIVFLLTFAVAASPASGGDAYVVTATMSGEPAYMAHNPDGTLFEQQDMLLVIPYEGIPKSFGNGLGDFNNDGELDYVMAVGNGFGDIYVFPKSGPEATFDPAIWVGSLSQQLGQGVNPADIAVADFNKDGNLDFVLNYLYSPNCGLYLGDGAFGFTVTILTNTTPYFGIGVDAADFNNDGWADFVIASDPGQPFRVHLNRGEEPVSFEAVPIHGSPTNGLAGIAAGDFIPDPDGNVDLAVSGNSILDIYAGNGDGTFVLVKSHTHLPVNSSPLDNGDFNRDGLQDLVAADYGADNGAVAVLIGDGTGNFAPAEDTPSLGGPAGPRRAVAALPYYDNKAPVASLTPEVIQVTVGQTVEWDASASFDEDGTIVSYDWDYGDGAAAPDAMTTMDAAPMAVAGGGKSSEPKSSYTYLDSGTYYVTLTVTDDQGATDTIQAEVQVRPLEFDVYFLPRRLNLNSRGKWITATIRVPAPHDARMITSDNLRLVLPNHEEIMARSVYVPKWRYNHHKKKYRRARKLIAKFDRQALIGAIDGTTGEIPLSVTGVISSKNRGLGISGEGTITAYKKNKKVSFKHKLLKLIRHGFSRGESRNGKH